MFLQEFPRFEAFFSFKKTESLRKATSRDLRSKDTANSSPKSVKGNRPGLGIHGNPRTFFLLVFVFYLQGFKGLYELYVVLLGSE